MIDTWPPEGGSPIFIRGYHGKTYQDVIETYHRDAQLLYMQGYEPTGQHYAEGQWAVSAAVVATLLIPILIGIFLWLYMLASRPAGTLTVTYVRHAPSSGGSSAGSSRDPACE